MLFYSFIQPHLDYGLMIWEKELKVTLDQPASEIQLY